MDKRDIFIYHGQGSSNECVDMLKTSLLRNCTHYNVKLIQPKQIIQGEWQESCALLAIGGGYDEGYINALGKDGLHKIKTYVEEGGSFLGICAGAYLACRRIEFDKHGKLEVCGSRDLGFYPGTCIGPTFPGFIYDSEAGAYTAELTMTKDLSDNTDTRTKGSTCIADMHLDSTTVYFNGGGHFVLDRCVEYENIEVIAQYANAPDGCPHVAVVKCKVGQGVVLLSGPHIEYIADKMNTNDPFLTNVIPRLKETSTSRNAFFSIVLKMLNI